MRWLIGPSAFLLVAMALVPAAKAQYLAVSGGVIKSQKFEGSPPAGFTSGALADFSQAGVLSVDGGTGLLPFLRGQVHYSFAKPGLSLRRADILGSRAEVDVSSHTIAFDVALQTPQLSGFRLYGLVGAGFVRFHSTLLQQVESPFPAGPPGDVMSPAVSFGGGLDHSILPFLRWRAELRDDVASMSKTFYQPGGGWHRVQVLGGLVIGR